MFKININRIPLIIFFGTVSLFFLIADGCIINLIGTFVYGSFYIAVYVGCKLNKKKHIDLRFDTIKHSAMLTRITYLLNFISIIGSILYLATFIVEFGGIYQLINAGWAIRERMAEGELGSNLFINGLTMLAYPTLFLTLYSMLLGAGSRLVIMSTIPLLITAVSQAARAGLIIVMMMILSTMIAKYTITNKERKIFSIGLKVSLMVILIFVTGLLYRDNNLPLELILKSARDYALGGFMGFNAWIANYELDWPSLGKYAFASIYLKFVPGGLPIGYYDNYLEICSDGAVTNIFSLYRPLIEDFTYPVGIFFSFMAGYLIKFSINQIMKGKTQYFPLYLYLMTGLLYSFVAPITQHTSLIIALIFSTFVIKHTKEFE